MPPSPGKISSNDYTRSSPVGHRRRVVFSADPSAGSSSTLLPTTFTSQTKSSSHAMQQFNTFLLGGTYYPGKDKKRRQLKRKTLWYRLFCSSRWKKAISCSITAYLLFSHVFKPFATSMVEYGNILFPSRRRNGLHGTWLLFDQSLLKKIKSAEEERADALLLRHESGPQHASRLKALERIVPGWYHRNDENMEQDKVVEEQLKEDERIVEEREATRKKNKNASYQGKERGQNHRQKIQETEPPKDDNEHRKSQMSQREKRKLTNASDEKIPSRTIHNMHSFQNRSSCPQHLESSDIRITLVMQSTAERLWILKRTCKRWTDPILVVVFWKAKDDMTTQLDSWSQNGACPQLTLIHHVMDSTIVENDKEMYPVNRLRNLGLDAVETSHVLMVDIDFVPSRDLPSLIRPMLVERNRVREHPVDSILTLPPEEREALVVPAFERIPPSELCKGSNCAGDSQKDLSNLVLPETFHELRACVLDHNECRVFQSHNNWDGHSSTRSESWLDGKWYDAENEPSGETTDNNFHALLNHSAKIRRLKCFDSVRYEPYVVLRWCPSSTKDSSVPLVPVAPYYDERFHGYGKNKIQLISHLRIMGYSFSILPEGFIIHTPHQISKAKKAWESKTNSTLHSNMDHLYPEFLKELVALYKHEGRKIIKQC